MKRFNGKKLLSLGIISIATASLLYADTLETPPEPTTVESTIEVPPSTGDIAPQNSCDNGSYFNPVLGSCTQLKPISLAELQTGVWLDIVVDKSTMPPTATTDISGCTTIANGTYSGDLNITEMFKDENNNIVTENADWAYYDETTGMLQISFPSSDDTYDTVSGATEMETLYVTRETIGDQNLTFLVREEYFDGQYQMFVDGLIENNTTATCEQVSQLSNFVFENDYFNPNADMAIQLSGHISLPDDINPNDVHINAVGNNWTYLSGSSLDSVEGNAFTLGFDTAQDAAIQVNINTPDNWYEFFYTPETGLVPADWSKPIEEYMFNISSTVENIDINITEFFESQVKIDGSITFNSTDNVSIEFIDMQNGMYFGWDELQDSGTFSTMLSNSKVGSKYVMKINKYSDDWTNWESYFVSLDENNQSKLISDTNIEWNSYIVDDNTGELVKSDNYDPDTYSMWLPDFAKTGFIEVPASGNIADINITLTDDALDSQFYIVDGNVTLPNGFSGNVSFETINATSGEWLSWTQLNSDNTFKIKMDSPADVIVRVNLEEEVNGMFNYTGYYLKSDGTLVNDRDIKYTPVLKDWDGNDLIVLDKTSEQCMMDNNFWHQEPNSETGVCYNDFPSNWIPDVTQTGSISLTNDDKKKSFALDFAAIESNVYKLRGTITLPSEFTPNYQDWENRRAIMVEAIDASTGMWLGSTNISETPESGNTYAYSLRLDGVDASTDIIVRLIKEDNTVSDGTNWESYFIKFNDAANLSDVSFVSEQNVQWVESNVTDDWGYNYWVPDADAINIGTLDGNDDNILSLDVDYTTIMANYTSNRLALKGTIVLTEPITLGQTSNYSWNNVRVEVINTNNGDWIGSKDAFCADSTSCTNLNFDIDVPGEGNYTFKVVKEIDGTWEEYYYNFGEDHDVNGTNTATNDKLINGQNIEWVEAEDYPSWGGDWKNWIPSPAETGYITMLSDSGQKELSIDFNAFESSRLMFAGTVTVPFDFEVGSFCNDGITETVKICDWEKPENIGYNNWVGSKYLRVEALDALTGEYVASADLRSKIVNTDDYEFKLPLGEKNGEQRFIIKINKEESVDGQWKYDEIYYNFGSDNTYTGIVGATDGETLVNGKRVSWIESNTTNDWGYKNWMPDVTQTGFISLEQNSVDNFNVDISTLGKDDLKIKGTVTFKDDFNLSNNNSFADVSAIDATTGMWIGNAPIENDGSFELNLGDVEGEYILQVNYSYNDYNNWQNSWWKNKYYDFGADKAYGTSDDKILNDSDVRWVPNLGEPISGITTDSQCWQNGNFWDYDSGDSALCYPQPDAWVPNVNGLTVDATVSDVDIDLSAAIGNSLNIEITNFPTGATNKYVMVVNPLTYSNIWQNMDGNSTTLTEIKDGNYTVEFGYEQNGQWKNFFMAGTNDSAISGNEVRWTDLGNGVWGPDSADTTYLALSEDTNISITIPAIVSNTVNVTVTGLDDAQNVSADFRSLTKPYGAWEQNTSVGSNVGFSFTDIKNDKFILSFWYDGNEYVYDNATPTVLKKDPEWVAKTDSNGDGTLDTIECGGSAGWDCNWNDSSNWMWTPDVTPLTINAVTTDLTLALPVALKVTGAINLSNDFAGKNVYVSIFNGNDWNWKDFVLDANGDVNGSIKVNGGFDYRVEIWVDGLGGYVYDNAGTPDDSSDDSWISQMKSWDETTWMPKDSTLIDIDANLDLGVVTIGSDFKTVTISMENLDTADGAIIEDVWVSLESDTLGYFGDGNANWENYPVTYDKNITLKVPSGDYKLLVFPMNHRGGFLSDDSTVDNTIADATATFTEIGWNEADSFTIDTDEVITVSLPVLANLKEINGTVVCKDTTTDGIDNNDADANCEGWIDAWSGTTGKGSIVNANGTFIIKGLEAANYDLTYWSFDQSLNGLTLESDANVSSASVTDITIKKEAGSTIESITGTVTVSDNDNENDYAYYVALIEFDGTNWEVIGNTVPDVNDGSFSFGSMPKPNGKSLTIAVAARTFADGASTVAFSTTTIEVYDLDDNITTVDLGTRLDASFGLSAQTN